MVVRTIEMLLEYISIILCIHKIAKEKIRFNIWVFLNFLMEWILIIIVDAESKSLLKTVFVYSCLFFYTKDFILQTWRNTIKILGLMTVIISTLQLLFMFVVTMLISDEKNLGIIVNIFVLLICVCWKEKYWKILINIFKRINGLAVIAIIYVGILIQSLYLCSKTDILQISEALKLWFEILILSILFVLLFIEENKNRHKEKELQMYQLYNQAFEETIATIRIRQHEFENHINAIKCMRYSIYDQEELNAAQEQYCNEVLQESEIGNLLKLRLEPALVGFLYAKITTAQGEGIDVEYKVEPIDIDGIIKVYELIEVLGILFDNAVEALAYNTERKIILRLLKRKNGFWLEIANLSRIYSNEEMEKFCVKGYSTKGEKHGIGLSRVKEIIKKVNAELLIQNQTYGNDNYLCFKIYFE